MAHIHLAKTLIDTVSQMSKLRRAIVSACLTLLIAGSSLSIIRDQEFWPFSQYEMYSNVDNRASISVLRLYGVTTAPRAGELPLLDHDYIAPFDQARLAAAMTHLVRRHGAHGAAVREALVDCLRRYERRRAAGRHHGPRLAAIRLYRLEWKRPVAQRPDARQLIAEVTR